MTNRPPGDTDFLVDYRPEEVIPDICPVCSAPITKHEQRGRIHVGPGDLGWAKEYGITTEGPVETLWTRWECSRDPDHEAGPYLLAGTP